MRTGYSERVRGSRAYPERGAESDADTKINNGKTKGLHVRSQDAVSKTTHAEASKICKFVCPHPTCGHRFYTKRGMQIHAGKCSAADQYLVEKILDSKGPTCCKKYLVRWEGYSSEHDQCVSHKRSPGPDQRIRKSKSLLRLRMATQVPNL